MTTTLTEAQLLKFSLFADGMTISPPAAQALREITEGRALTPADYASTTGLILRLADDVWVNAPIEQHNANFVNASSVTLDHERDGFFIHGDGLASPASFWVPPRYHGSLGADGRPLNNYVFTHSDRVRLSPTIGCAMVCTFCNIPYDDAYRGLKPIDSQLVAVRAALQDDLQPARHLLISGGTPGPPQVQGLREVYERVLAEFPTVRTDIMMVPVEGLFDLPRLEALGLNEISINIEIFRQSIAAGIMRHKHRQGLDYYLTFLSHAAEVLGGHRVRSMLMVGLEPLEDTLRGVQAIVERGCVPVLSPFRPDPITPLGFMRPPSATELRETYLRSTDLALAAGVPPGPTCPPCSHNTLTFVPPSADGKVAYEHELPFMLSGAAA